MFSVPVWLKWRGLRHSEVVPAAPVSCDHMQMGEPMRRPSAAIISLIALVLVDIVLVTGAIRSTHVSSSELAEVPTYTGTDDASPAAPSSGSTASEDPQQTGKVIVSALSSVRAWRAVSPSTTCAPDAKRAVVGHSDDAGKTWTPVEVPMTTVSGLSYDSGRMIATGLDGACKPVIYALTSSSDPERTTSAAAWGVDPEDLTRLLAAGKPVAKQPCSGAVLDVAADSKSDAVVLCQDGAVEHTSDGGSSWSNEDKASDAVAIATAAAGQGKVYVAERVGCGISVIALDDSTPQTASCVSGTKSWSGAVDLTIVAGTMWLTGTEKSVTEPVGDLA